MVPGVEPVFKIEQLLHEGKKSVRTIGSWCAAYKQAFRAQ